MKIFICGFSGAGKSTWLKNLERKNTQSGEKKFLFEDLDEVIAHAKNIDPKKLGEWISVVGVEEFRKVESFEFKKLLRSSDHLVVALGGGTLGEEALKELNSTPECFLVYLQTDFEVCYENIHNDPNRLLSKRTKTELLELFKQREVNYLQAHLILDWEARKEIEGLDRLVHTLRGK
jgi:shikimate kinase